MQKSNKEYSSKFYEKHKEEIKEKKICEICGGKYDYTNKSHHNKTKKHIHSVQLIDRMKQQN